MKWFRKPKSPKDPVAGDGLLDHPDLSRLPAEMLADLPMPRPCNVIELAERRCA